jgi:large subunit ribosomal protein L6
MSRIGKQPIPIPSGVSVEIETGMVRVKGASVVLEQPYQRGINVRVDDGQVVVERRDDSRAQRAYHGLTRALIANMVTGVSEGFTKSLDLVGYRVQAAGRGVNLQVGYSHPTVVEPMEGITLEVQGNNRILVRGADKQVVGEMAARIRRVRKPDAYKGKGIRYTGEQLRLKPGKTAGRS